MSKFMSLGETLCEGATYSNNKNKSRKTDFKSVKKLTGKAKASKYGKNVSKFGRKDG